MPTESVQSERNPLRTQPRMTPRAHGEYEADVRAIWARRKDNGGEYWASADGRVGVGSPFSTVQCVVMLMDLGVQRDDPMILNSSGLILNCWRKDGVFRLAPHGDAYPCHTAAAAKALCRAGFAKDERLERTFEHLAGSTHADGGWRCSKFMYGRGPETECSNPGPTLDALDAFRFVEHSRYDDRLDKAVEFLLGHWTTRKPLGPCHFGIGTLFMKVEYPLFRYNLFNYVYVLSFYQHARSDPRFQEALRALQAKLVDRMVVVENPNRRLAGLSFCRKGMPSAAATRHYREVLRNLRS